MLTIAELFAEVDRLEPVEQWHLVKHLLDRLEHEQILASTRVDYHQFLIETYGSLRNTSIERPDQGEYEIRESLA